MICYRRFMRKQLVAILLILFVVLWFFIKSKSFIIISKDSDGKHSQAVNYLPVDSKEADSEFERLSNFQNSKDFEYKLGLDEHEQMMKKYNESLKRQEIEEDPFHQIHLEEAKYTDFSNFKINFTQTNYKPEQLRDVVKKLNAEQLIYNSDKLMSLKGDFVVIIVQVHKRVEYFKELLDSLQRAKGIEKALLVISHDYYTDEMNALIRMIKFCPVSIKYCVHLDFLSLF